jgi:phosphatidylinositol glycan class W
MLAWWETSGPGGVGISRVGGGGPQASGGGARPPPGDAQAPAASGAKAFSRRSLDALGGELFVMLCRLAVASAGLWLGVGLLEECVEPVSRRAANATYVLWVTALCVTLVTGCLVSELMGGVLRTASRGAPHLLLALNRNMLALFLAANLMTGAVNLSINTLAVGDWAARGVVGAYLAALAALAVGLDYAGLTLKFW